MAKVGLLAVAVAQPVLGHVPETEVFRVLRVVGFFEIKLQGDHSGCFQPPVDIKTKVPFLNEGHVLKRSLFCVNVRLGTT